MIIIQMASRRAWSFCHDNLYREKFLKDLKTDEDTRYPQDIQADPLELSVVHTDMLGLENVVLAGQVFLV